MLVYHYDRETHRYLGSEEARLDPLEKSLNGRDVFLFPANSTIVGPPQVPDDCVAVWTGEEWIVKQLPALVVEEPMIITEQEEWELFKNSLPNDDSALRKSLYGFLRCRLVGDSLQGALDTGRPFLNGMTVDEMSQGYLNYIGDDDVKATTFLKEKREAKAYVRSIFFEGANDGQPC